MFNTSAAIPTTLLLLVVVVLLLLMVVLLLLLILLKKLPGKQRHYFPYQKECQERNFYFLWLLCYKDWVLVEGEESCWTWRVEVSTLKLSWDSFFYCHCVSVHFSVNWAPLHVQHNNSFASTQHQSFGLCISGETSKSDSEMWKLKLKLKLKLKQTGRGKWRTSIDGNQILKNSYWWKIPPVFPLTSFQEPCHCTESFWKVIL